MNTKYEACPVEEATHARTATGELTKVYKSAVGNFRVHVDSCAIVSRLWEQLGITPVKPVPPPQPMEFVANFYKEKDGNWYPLYTLDEALGAQGIEQKKFRCVEIVD